MALISNLLRNWKNRKAANSLAHAHAVKLAEDSVRKVWIDHESSKGFSQKEIDDLANAMTKEAMEVLSSSNPYMVNRVRLAASVQDLAQYLVLVMDPAPAADVTGFRGSEVTGELKSRLEKLSRIKSYLKIWTNNDKSAVSGYEDLCNLVLARYQVSLARSGLLQSLSLALEGNPARPDWFRPFIHSMCANQEHHFRLDLKMPSVLDPDADRASLIASQHSLFFNLVRHGLDDPLEAWQSVVDHIEYEDDKLAVYNLYAREYPI
jgi:hypothetical protein